MPTSSATMSRRDQRRSSQASIGAGPKIQRATEVLSAGRDALKRPKKPGGGMQAITGGGLQAPAPGAPSSTMTTGMPGGPMAAPAPGVPEVDASGLGSPGGVTGVGISGGMPGVTVSPRGDVPPAVGPPGPAVAPGPGLPMEKMLPPGVSFDMASRGGGAAGPTGAPDMQALIQRLKTLGVGPGFAGAFPGLGPAVPQAGFGGPGAAMAPPMEPPAGGFRPDRRFSYA